MRLRRRPRPKTVEQWAAHWNAKATIENPVELNGYCIDGTPIDANEPVSRQVLRVPDERIRTRDMG